MPRKYLRRAASKEASKQMHLSASTEEGNSETLQTTSDDDVMNSDMPPKKKYRLSHRKSSDGNDRDVIVLKTVNSEETLKLEFWTEDLEPAQVEYRNKIDNEVKELEAKIEQIVKQTSSEVIYQGETCAAYEIDNTNVVPSLTYIGSDPQNQAAIPSTSKAQSTVVLPQPKGGNTQQQSSYQLVMDPRLGLIVGTMTPTASTSTPPPLQTKPVQTRQTRRRGRNSVTQIQAQSQPQPAPSATKLIKAPSATPPTIIQLRPTESTAIGGLSTGTTEKPATNSSSNVVDLTTDDSSRPVDDSREIAFNKLQGKTFPSLVVVARPHLVVKDATSDRAKLDSKVKNVLMHVPTKFTEWLIQQGLIRSEQLCANHPQNKLKLGMYSDVSKFPYSGGYVWISECCPHRFVSVFSGSLFESSPHPPSVLLKLIYHWACQTNIQNVVQWVKVDNLFVKGVNSWLRALCTVALHTHIPPLGGPGLQVEVGVISLGTTTQDGSQRQVKVEVLGILETSKKSIRLRAVEPLQDGDRNPKRRFLKILEPLSKWVHPDTTLITDPTVDKSILYGMGFKRVYQSIQTNSVNNTAIMDYLRRIVPRMFQNTLSLLSRQIIQQFLDELVWREWYGSTAAQCFDNILLHISEQTRAEAGQALTARLNKVSTNPFRNWSIQATTAPVTVITKQPVPTNDTPSSSNRRIGRSRKSVPESSTLATETRPPRVLSPDIPEQLVPLENYYYGTMESQDPNTNVKAAWNIKCSMCKSVFSNNIKLMSHLFSHAHNVIGGVQQCRYCLSSVGSQEGLAKHITSSHPFETKFQDGFACVICESKFSNTFSLGKHLSKEHVPSELPYQCGTCGFRCSSHRQVIDHFYKLHDSGCTIQCPFCLKSTTLWSTGRTMPQNLNFFMQHLQKHQKKAMAKKCPKCALWFIHKDTLKDHQLNMHQSQKRKLGIIAWSIPKACVMVPKSKQDLQVWEDTKREINFANLTFDVPNKLVCKECRLPVNAPKHFQALDSCSNRNCQYSTCCETSMKTHADMCKALNNSLPASPLSKAMYCVCGYSDDDGNTLAKHLAECERKSAYPSTESAKSAIKTHSMLDVLGLVRRPEEPPAPTIEIIEIDEENDQDDVNAVQNKSIKRKRSQEENDINNAKKSKQAQKTEQEQKPETEKQEKAETKKDGSDEIEKVENIEKEKGHDAQDEKSESTSTEKPEIKIGESEKPKTTEIEESKTTEIEEPKTTEIEEPKTTGTEEPKTTETEEPKTTETEEPKTTETEEPKTTETEKSETAKTEMCETENSEITELDASESTETENFKTTEKENSEIAEIDESETINTEKSKTAKKEKSEATELEKSEATKTEESNTTETEGATTSETKELETTEIKESEITEIKEPETTEAKEPETTETKVSETIETKVSETTETKVSETTETNKPETSEIKEPETTETKEPEISGIQELETIETKEPETTQTKESETSEIKELETTEANEPENSEGTKQETIKIKEQEIPKLNENETNIKNAETEKNNEVSTSNLDKKIERETHVETKTNDILETTDKDKTVTTEINDKTIEEEMDVNKAEDTKEPKENDTNNMEVDEVSEDN